MRKDLRRKRRVATVSLSVCVLETHEETTLAVCRMLYMSFCNLYAASVCSLALLRTQSLTLSLFHSLSLYLSSLPVSFALLSTLEQSLQICYYVELNLKNVLMVLFANGLHTDTHTQTHRHSHTCLHKHTDKCCAWALIKFHNDFIILACWHHKTLRTTWRMCNTFAL